MGGASAAKDADFLAVRFRVALRGASALGAGVSLVAFLVVRLVVAFLAGLSAGVVV